MSDLGRPPFKPTAAHRDKVELYAACGMTHANIARALGISKETLEKYFADELARGPAKKHAEALSLLRASAEKGNVSAQKKLVEITAASNAASEALTDHEEPRSAVTTAKMGKKEEAQAAAQTAGDGTRWETVLRHGRLPN